MLPYVDGRLSDREYAAVGAHLQHCPTCAGEVAAVRGLCELLDQDTPEMVPRGLENATMRRIREGEAAEEETQGRRWLLPLAAGLAAAGLAVYLSGGGKRLTGGRDRLELASKRNEREVAATAPKGPSVAEPSEDVPGGAPAQFAGTARRAGAGGPAGEVHPVGRETRVAATDELPLELRDTLGLFVDFPIIDELDKFEHYDSIWSVTNEHAGRPRGG